MTTGDPLLRVMPILIYKPAQIMLLLLLCFGSVAAASANVFVDPRVSNLNFYLGSLQAEEEAGVLEDPSSQIAIGLASSAQSRNYPFLALDLELWLLASEYTNTLAEPFLVSIDDDMELETSAITIGARFMYPYNAPYRFYVSGGYGYFYSELRVYANMLGVPGYFDDTSQEFAPYIGAGVTFNLGYRQTLELFYRRWNVEGDFSRFDIPQTEIGGEAFGIGFGMYW